MAKAQIYADQVGEITVVRFSHSSLFGLGAIDRVRARLSQLIDQDNRTKLLLDFSRVRSFNSAFLASLLDVKHKLDAVGGRIALSSLNENLRRVMTLTQLDKVFEIFSTEDEALKEMG